MAAGSMALWRADTEGVGKSPGKRPGALGPAPNTGSRKEADDVAVF